MTVGNRTGEYMEILEMKSVGIYLHFRRKRQYINIEYLHFRRKGKYINIT